MPVTVVVGGQFGGEGKGKICAHLALTDNVDYMVRCGGPNSGHTVDLDGQTYQLHQVPVGFVNPRTRLLVAAGALINPRTLFREIDLLGIDTSRLGIDENTGIIEESDIEVEWRMGMRDRLGSTATGVGAALSRRVLRTADFRQAKDVAELKPYVTSVRHELAQAVRRDQRVVVEGTQGFGLSLYHASQWPYRTGRDTTAHSFLGEVGLGVRGFEVIMCMRTFPIRVGGNSGPVPNEITWEELTKLSGYPYPVKEYTTTTKRLRRVAGFDWQVVEEAIDANAPTALALHGSDYLDYQNKGVTTYRDLTTATRQWIENLENRSRIPIRWIGTGPLIAELVDIRVEPTTATLTGRRRTRAGSLSSV
jgi:adenylosuccinate synthase